jgi:ubiquinone/menaquinone biosynthesis C-methylase UbiE
MKNYSAESIRVAMNRVLTEDGIFYLELGAGHGMALQELVSKGITPKRVVCVEISPQFQKELKNLKLPFEMELHEDDCKTMPYLENDAVDILFAMNVIYFLDPLPEYLAEMYRVLKPGTGKMSLGCKFQSIPQNSNIFVNADEAVVVKMIREAGFEVTSTFLDLGDPKVSFTELLCTKPQN